MVKTPICNPNVNILYCTHVYFLSFRKKMYVLESSQFLSFYMFLYVIKFTNKPKLCSFGMTDWKIDILDLYL